MGAANTTVRNSNEYQEILGRHPVVFALFVSNSCPACVEATPRFKRIAISYDDRVKSIVLNLADTPKLDELINEVTGTPTLLVYQNGQVIKNLKGLGDPEEQEEELHTLFRLYADT